MSKLCVIKNVPNRTRMKCNLDLYFGGCIKTLSGSLKPKKEADTPGFPFPFFLASLLYGQKGRLGIPVKARLWQRKRERGFA